jgi:hypothetical protein
LWWRLFMHYEAFNPRPVEKARWSCNMKYELARQMPHQMVEGVGTCGSMYQPPLYEAASHSKYAEASGFQRRGMIAGFIVPVVQMLGRYGGVCVADRTNILNQQRREEEESSSAV